MKNDLQPLVGDDRGVRQGSSTLPWDEQTDLAVVGFGAAGASAAIEARGRGLDVLVADRFAGGGATKLSAGVVYFGGGTQLQQDSGWEDTPEMMFDYLKMEVDDVVSDATLEAFCQQSVENFEFLRDLGVPFPSSGKALKTSYPPDDCTLYFSGNELCEPYASQTPPAPRGHRALGKGLTGHLIFGALQSGAKQSGAQIRPHTKRSDWWSTSRATSSASSSSRWPRFPGFGPCIRPPVSWSTTGADSRGRPTRCCNVTCWAGSRR